MASNIPAVKAAENALANVEPLGPWHAGVGGNTMTTTQPTVPKSMVSNDANGAICFIMGGTKSQLTPDQQKLVAEFIANSQELLRNLLAVVEQLQISNNAKDAEIQKLKGNQVAQPPMPPQTR